MKSQSKLESDPLYQFCRWFNSNGIVIPFMGACCIFLIVLGGMRDQHKKKSDWQEYTENQSNHSWTLGKITAATDLTYIRRGSKGKSRTIYGVQIVVLNAAGETQKWEVWGSKDAIESLSSYRSSGYILVDAVQHGNLVYSVSDAEKGKVVYKRNEPYQIYGGES